LDQHVTLYANDALSPDQYSALGKYFAGKQADKKGSRWIRCEYDWFENFCIEVFQISAVQFVHRALSARPVGREGHGVVRDILEDRKGKYTIRNFDRHMKRPKRCRFDGWLDAVVSDFQAGNIDVGNNPRTLYRCMSCNNVTDADGFLWRSMPGLSGSDYPSRCKNCGASTGDILDKMADPDKNGLSVEEFYEGRPMLTFPYNEANLAGYLKVA
jgi:hypothetical protein